MLKSFRMTIKLSWLESNSINFFMSTKILQSFLITLLIWLLTFITNTWSKAKNNWNSRAWKNTNEACNLLHPRHWKIFPRQCLLHLLLFFLIIEIEILKPIQRCLHQPNFSKIKYTLSIIHLRNEIWRIGNAENSVTPSPSKRSIQTLCILRDNLVILTSQWDKTIA